MRSPPSRRRCRRAFRHLLLERLESRVVPGFLAPLAFDAGSVPVSMVVGDFNGDGYLDLAVASAGSASVSVLLGNGDGSFQSARNFPAGRAPVSVAVGDFDGDGHLDLAVANAGTYPSFTDSTVSVFLGNGDGNFQSARNFPAGSYPESVAVGDFDGDGHLDLAVANYFSASAFSNASTRFARDSNVSPAIATSLCCNSLPSMAASMRVLWAETAASLRGNVPSGTS